uniref:Uncharacterized protein n=1 Tax=Avena sativa TaxID=4498 RepID=A0ACD6A2N8_AVESA
MLLYTVQFLCSVVATFNRLLRALRKAMAAVLCSPPVSVPTASSPLSMRRTTKVHPIVSVAVGGDDQRACKDHQLFAPAVDAFAPCNGSATVVEQVEPAKKAARRRPSMLVIPVVPEAGEAPAGWGVVVAEKEAEVEVEGEGFRLASRRGARHAMEDAYCAITHKICAESQLAFYGVYDGHGGRAAVDFVSERLGKNVVAAVLARTAEAQESAADASSSSSVDATAAAIRSAYLATDSEFLGQGVRGGSCAATALVKDGDLYVANLGDCTAAALTSDHTAARGDERARIESSGGYVSCGNNGVWRVQDCLAVSRAFGDASLKRWVISEPEITRLPLTAGCEFLVLASDGLWNKVSNQEAVDAVSRTNAGRGNSSADCCKDLVDMARSRGSRDDITVMVVDLKRFT